MYLATKKIILEDDTGILADKMKEYKNKKLSHKQRAEFAECLGKDHLLRAGFAKTKRVYNKNIADSENYFIKAKKIYQGLGMKIKTSQINFILDNFCDFVNAMVEFSYVMVDTAQMQMEKLQTHEKSSADVASDKQDPEIIIPLPDDFYRKCMSQEVAVGFGGDMHYVSKSRFIIVRVDRDLKNYDIGIVIRRGEKPSVGILDRDVIPEVTDAMIHDLTIRGIYDVIMERAELIIKKRNALTPGSLDGLISGIGVLCRGIKDHPHFSKLDPVDLLVNYCRLDEDYVKRVLSTDIKKQKTENK